MGLTGEQPAAVIHPVRQLVSDTALRPQSYHYAGSEVKGYCVSRSRGRYPDDAFPNSRVREVEGYLLPLTLT